MERWLSKPRVLLLLSLVLLAASLNRHDPTFYGMFLFLAMLSLLGWALPWLSLRAISVRAEGGGEALEGETAPLNLVVERQSWWPAFMVDLQTHWAWGAADLRLHHTLPVVRRRQPVDLGGQLRFPCRGQYRLQEVVLSSGFPLGLFTAQRRISPAAIQLLVLPRAAQVVLPGTLQVSEDALGERFTARLGHSTELGQLRTYEPGDALGRVHWRASARTGELMVQHFQQSGSPLLRVVSDIPSATEAGQPNTPAELAIRAAVGLCQQALHDGARVRAYLPASAAPLEHMPAIWRALAGAAPGSQTLPAGLARAACDLRAGEHIVAVVGTQWGADDLLRHLAAIGHASHRTLVVLALGIPAPAGRQQAQHPLAKALVQAGYTVVPSYR